MNLDYIDRPDKVLEPDTEKDDNVATDSQDPDQEKDQEETKGQTKDEFGEEDKRHDDFSKFY